MRKFDISNTFLYRYRFLIGYISIGLVFAAVIIFLPYFSIHGLTDLEIESATQSGTLSLNTIFEGGQIVNLPYHLLQKLSIHLFGLSLISIKLPSIIIALISSALLILLLNRWFKNNVALIASCFIVPTSLFLVATLGTPQILLVFYPIAILYFSAKVIGAKNPGPIIPLLLVATLALSLYTPYFIYLVAIIFIISLYHPHLRHTLRSFSKINFAILASLSVLFITPIVIACFYNTSALSSLLFVAHDTNFFKNLADSFAPFFTFTTSSSTNLLAPSAGLALTIIAIIGVFSVLQYKYSSRIQVTLLLLAFAVFAIGMNPTFLPLIFTPFVILIASGIELILNKWYDLFPLNPYARLFGLIPIAIFTAIIITSNILHFYYGFQYNQTARYSYNDDLSLVREYVEPGNILIAPDHTDFYQILQTEQGITVMSTLPDEITSNIAILGTRATTNENLTLKRIITSPNLRESDRLYLYTMKNEEN